MTRFHLAAACLCLGLVACTRAPQTPVARTAPLAICEQVDTSALKPSPEVATAHLLTQAPVVHLPFGTERNSSWRTEVRVQVDAHGNTQCYVNKALGSDSLDLGPSELQALAQMRFKPFGEEGSPANASVEITLRREESPERERPLPEVPPDQVAMTLSRSGCYGNCPSYRVTVHGDGRVDYEGGDFADVTQAVSYRIPVDRVAHLVEQVRKSDLWSLRDQYHAPMTDNSTYQLRLQFGDEVHSIADYVGEMVGMPQSVSDFEDELDRVSGARGMVSLDMEGLGRLRDAGFDFTSPSGAALLRRAIGNAEVKDEVVLALLEAGAPVEDAPDMKPSFLAPPPLHRGAALYGRASALPLLFAKGAFDTQGHRDPAKINEAFEAAIASGNLATVQGLWTLSGERARPSLTVMEEYEDNKLPSHRKRIPIVLKLDAPHLHASHPWQGMEIAQWLAQKGNDLKARGADGRTLLSVAAEANDLAFVRFLLAQGLDPATAGQYGTPLGATDDENVALALLEAGAPLSDWKNRMAFQDYARERPWPRVLDWLQTHQDKPTPGG